MSAFDLKISCDTKGTKWDLAPGPQSLNLCNTICNTWLRPGLTFSLWLPPPVSFWGRSYDSTNIGAASRCRDQRSTVFLARVEADVNGDGKGRSSQWGKDGGKREGRGARRGKFRVWRWTLNWSLRGHILWESLTASPGEVQEVSSSCQLFENNNKDHRIPQTSDSLFNFLGLSILLLSET